MDTLQQISEFIIEKVGDLWGAQTTMWGWHKHPDFDRLSAEFQDILRRECGQEEATRATAELLCYANRPQEVDKWMAGATWIESEKRLRIGFGAWLWQAHHPSAQARDLFMKEFEWQTHHPMPRFPRSFYLASFALSSWLGKIPKMLGYAAKPVRLTPDERSLEMVETIIRREWLPWRSRLRPAARIRCVQKIVSFSQPLGIHIL